MRTRHEEKGGATFERAMVVGNSRAWGLNMNDYAVMTYKPKFYLRRRICPTVLSLRHNIIQLPISLRISNMQCWVYDVRAGHVWLESRWAANCTVYGDGGNFDGRLGPGRHQPASLRARSAKRNRFLISQRFRFL